MSEVVLSGIRATGRLHVGSLLGAVQNFKKLQVEGNTCLYFIADWHTLTTLNDPEELRGNLIEVVKDYLAAGLDPDQSIIYAQSSVRVIAELALYLSMLQLHNDLMRVPSLKDLTRKKDESALTLGIVSYPVLMAADILGPRATLVPVGEDQVGNVSLARVLAERFNKRFGEVLVVPDMLKQMLRVPGLDGNKMGKSDSENAIGLHMTRAEIEKRYKRKGLTDPARKRATDPGDPFNKCASVYPVHRLVTQSEQEGGSLEIARACQEATIGCGECKARLAESLAAVIEPFQERRAALEGKDAYVREVLEEGGRRARERFEPTVEAVAEKMGIIRY